MRTTKKYVKGEEKSMTNWEKYKDIIIDADRERKASYWFENNIDGYKKTSSLALRAKIFIDWCNEEYIEPETDWTKVEKGTHIEVCDDGCSWEVRKFFCYEESFCEPFVTYNNPGDGIFTWKYARLIKE